MSTQAHTHREKIAVFGFKDTLVGQTLEMLKAEQVYEIAYFIAVNGTPAIDIESEHLKRPNRKTEFVKDGNIFGAPVFSTRDYIHKLTTDGLKKVLVLEDTGQQRSEIFQAVIEADIEPISYIHPSTVFGGQNTIGKGVVILPNCYIGYKTDIGDGTIVQSSCVIEHHTSVGKFCDINPRLTTGGCTYIGDFVEINISVDIINRIRIETGARVGAGSLVLRNCERNMLYYGRPARKVRPTVIADDTDA
jgi:UDP-N-acetylbacillosamine N-acetyltransferase